MKIANKVKAAVAALAVVAMGVVSMPAMAVQCPAGTLYAGQDKPTLAQCSVKADEDNKDLMSMLNTVINVALAVIGFVAVVMIILGGVQYTTSAGDSGRVKKAKDTIMYGIIGLVVALLAYAIVNFVLSGIFA